MRAPTKSKAHVIGNLMLPARGGKNFHEAQSRDEFDSIRKPRSGGYRMPSLSSNSQQVCEIIGRNEMQKNLLPSSNPMLNVLRRHLLLQMSGGEKRVANSVEIRKWILEQYRQNPTVADMYRAILLVREDFVLVEDLLPLPKDAFNVADLLENRPLPKNCFMSVTLGNGDIRGVLIQHDKLQVGGLVYVVTIFDIDKKFESVSRTEVRACSHIPEPFSCVKTTTGWLRFSKDDASENEHVVFVVQCLAAYHKYKYRKIPLDQIQSGPASTIPPTDGALDQLLLGAYRDKVPCTKVLLKLKKIEPEDIKFALQVPPDVIKKSMAYIVDSAAPSVELLLYERQGKLIMGDDYSIHLAYRALLFDEVPAVIIGKFDENGITVIQRGHSELIPPIVVSALGDECLLETKEDDQTLLRQKLSLLSPPKPTSTERLESIFIEFARLLSSHKTKERDLHRFISSNPVMVDGHLAAMFSEVCIGRYRADLVIRYEQMDKRVLLIELERHDDLIFKRSNRLRDKVNHASQQVEDWIAAVRNQVTPMPDWLDKSYVTEGAVVIGRSKDLTRVQRDTLFNINTNRIVKIITYDDLLERLNNLIGTLARQKV